MHSRQISVPIMGTIREVKNDVARGEPSDPLRYVHPKLFLRPAGAKRCPMTISSPIYDVALRSCDITASVDDEDAANLDKLADWINSRKPAEALAAYKSNTEALFPGEVEPDHYEQFTLRVSPEIRHTEIVRAATKEKAAMAGARNRPDLTAGR